MILVFSWAGYSMERRHGSVEKVFFMGFVAGSLKVCVSVRHGGLEVSKSVQLDMHTYVVLPLRLYFTSYITALM